MCADLRWSRAEDTFLTGYVTFDRARILRKPTRRAGQARLDQKIERGEFEVPKGVSYTFAGSYKNQLRSEARLRCSYRSRWRLSS